MGVDDRPLTDPRRKVPTREKRRVVIGQGPMTTRVQAGPMPREGAGQGPPVFTPKETTTSVCGCTVSSSAFKTHRRPKKLSSTEVSRSGHSCYNVLLSNVYSAWVCTLESGRFTPIRGKKSQLRLVEFPYFRGAWYFPGCVIFSGVDQRTYYAKRYCRTWLGSHFRALPVYIKRGCAAL